MAVGMDEVAGDILADGGCRHARQAEVHGSGAPERDIGPANHRADFETVAGQKAFRCEYAECIEVVMAFGLAALSPHALDPFHKIVTASEQGFVLWREGPYYRAADAPHERMHHGSQQRAATPPRGGAERQPREYLRLSHRPSDTPLKGIAKLVQGSRRGKFLVQREHDLVSRQRLMESRGPDAAIKVGTRQRAIGRSYPDSRRVVFHCANAAVKDIGGVFTRLRRNYSRFRPDFSLIVFSHRSNCLLCNPKKPRGEVVRSLGVFVIDDRCRGCNAGRTARVGIAECPQAADQAGGFRPQSALERVRLVKHQEIEPGVRKQFDVLLARSNSSSCLTLVSRIRGCRPAVRMISREQTSSAG